MPLNMPNYMDRWCKETTSVTLRLRREAILAVKIIYGFSYNEQGARDQDKVGFV